MALLPSVRAALQHCSPDRPLRLELPEDVVLYADLDAVRGHPRSSPTERLAHLILSADPLEPTAQLLMGPAGAGKSTEFQRLKQRLEAAGDVPTLVRYISLDPWIDPLYPVSVLTVLRALTEVLESEADEEDPLFSRWFKAFLREHPDIRDVPWHYTASGVQMQLRQDRTLLRQVERALRSDAVAYIQIAQQAMGRAVWRLMQSGVGRLVLIVDGLDRLSALGDLQIERSLERILIDQAALLRPPCHIVYSVPGWLGDKESVLQSLWTGGVVALPLPYLGPVHDVRSQCLDALETFLSLRVDISLVFGHDRQRTLLPLLMASGGCFRDVLKMVRAVIERAGRHRSNREVFPIQPPEVRAVMDGMRAEYGVLARRFGYETLRQLDMEQPSRLLYRAVDTGILIWHQERTRWFFPHPLGWPDPIRGPSKL